MWVCNWIATALSVSLKVNFSQNPSFTSQPRNPSSASEGAQLILQWNYNLQGQGIGSAVISNVTDGISVAPPVAGKTPGSNAAVTTGYEQVFSVAISDTQATLTFLALQRSDNGSKYRLSITTSGFFSLTSDVLDISVLKPAVINPDSKPSNPVVKENHNITLSWTYTLSDGVGSATFTIVASGETIAAKFGAGGKTNVELKYQQRFRAVITNMQAQLSILSAQRSDQGKYRLSVVTSTNLDTLTDVAELTVQFSAEVTKAHVSSEKNVHENSTVQLICEASGEPIPNITWAKVLENGHMSDIITLQNGKLIHNITNINRSEAGTYRCMANNGIGQSDHKELEVEVLYPARVVSLPSEYNAAAQQSKTLDCQAEGVPKPSVTWAPCDLSENVCNQSQLNIQEVIDDGVYTCTVKNDLGTDTAKTSVFIAAKDINVTLEITCESCKNGKYNQSAMLSKRLNETISKIFVNNSTYRNTAVRSVSCGSLFVDLTLTFSVIVKERMVLSILKEAAKDGKLGEFSVDPSSIVGTRPIKPTTSPPVDKTTTSAPTVKVCHECSCNCTILIAVVCILVAIIIALIIYVVWLHRKDAGRIGRKYQDPVNEKRKNNTEVEMLDFEPHLTEARQQTFESPSQSQYMALNEVSRSHDSQENPPKNIPQVSQYAPLHPSTRSWEIPRENVTIEKVIGKGAFGQVAKGTAVGLRGGSPKTQVAVKMLKDDAPESDRKDLLSELEVMKTLKPHPYVIKLLGCVTESEPLLVLIEYVPYGDLLGYLRKSRGLNDTYYKDPDVKPQTSLTSHQLMKSAWQIADGMNYLSSRSIIHRDLAARNVLVGEGETCKVTDFGMARDVQQENIYEKKTKGRLPVKWTACEALLYGTYTTKSDVWSYGVLLYEIFTIGGSPYPRMDGRKIASLLQQGYRMPKPKHVNDELYKMMTMCWQEDPNARPTFEDLRNNLKQMENQHKRLIDMNMYDTQLYANVEDLGV